MVTSHDALTLISVTLEGLGKLKYENQDHTTVSNIFYDI